jgi:glycosyltransferase involved in cell wall biosynthesis
VAQDSLLSDELLHHLMAVGHVDLLVGVPTLNNAATVRPVVKAVHQAFSRYFPRDRSVLINSDGGSDDGTPGLVRNASASDDTDTVTVSHSLRTVHRISTPYHGVPGKGNALRQIMAAAELTQARAVAVLNADVTGITAEGVAALIRPVRDQQFDYVAPVYQRHPLEGLLVTQLVRPLMRAAYGWQVREPVAPEFGCSNRFVSHCLEQDVWDTELGRVGIDLWVTGEALAKGFKCCQAGLSPHPATSTRTPFGELFAQVVESAFACLERHAPYWMSRNGSEPLLLASPPPSAPVDPPVVDGTRLTEAFAKDVENLRSVLEYILSGETLASLEALAEKQPARLRYPDALWVATVYEFLLAHRAGVMRRDHIVQALAPLYLGRTGSFLQQYTTSPEAVIDEALENLSREFERSKPDLIARWK